ncbi:MAG: hypothetical protein JSR26_07525 [Proteobacteria bacterium]|nr:hypothetical protein [Pseudomonadota bacterium]
MNAHWTNEQQRVLVALGYTPYQPVATPGAATLDAPAVDADDALVVAVLRAAGVDAAAAGDIATWWHARQLPPVAQLRAEPSCKRATWPRLRSLRTRRV